MNLLDTLISDEKKCDRKFYSSGPYWKHKNLKTIVEIKKNGIQNFRGTNNSIGTSFTDNLVCDIRKELNWKGRLLSKIFSLPLINKIFDLQLKQTKNYLQEYLKAISIIYRSNENVQKLVRKYKFENTVNFGCEKKFNSKDNKETSIVYIDMAHRIDVLSSQFDFTKIKSFFEIGGGFGANIHFLITNFPNINKIIYLDIAPNIYLGTEYLRYHYKDAVKDYLTTKKLDKISFSRKDELEIFCIPPWEIEKLEIEVDHFHNAASFVEMTNETIENYAKFIKKFKTKGISLISYDRFSNKTINPENLNSFFDNKLNIQRHSQIIDDYNQKLIYLYK